MKPKKKTDYKVRFVPNIKGAKINGILDALDAQGGHCPCQPEHTPATKCQCKDFRERVKIGEPCLCGIYTKVAKEAK
jgi:hypothetical protein